MHAGHLKNRKGEFFNKGDFSKLFGVKLRNKIIEPAKIYTKTHKFKHTGKAQSFCKFRSSLNYNQGKLTIYKRDMCLMKNLRE